MNEFVCVHCKRQATEKDIEEKVFFVRGKKKITITVYCPICKVHSHFIKKT